MLLSVLLATNLFTMTPSVVSNTANAIYLTEGGKRASSPYGILSVHVSGEAEARKVCERTIAHTYARWAAGARTKCFLDFLADSYCPPSADPKGNANWKRNMRSIIAK